MQYRLDVADLKLGHYVAELDRPWTETPFLFQGFVVSSEEELHKLRGLCDHVYVDAEQSRVPVEPRAVTLPFRRRKPRATLGGPTTAVTASRVADLTSFRRSAGHAGGVRERSRVYLQKVFKDGRLGASLDTDEAKEVVRGLVETISADANAAIWLTQLKRKDEYTSLHCLNVCVLTLAFCRHLGYSSEDLQMIGLGALLHDIGKTQTPLEILNKPGPLTRDEFAVMKRHPEDGYRLMLRTGQLPEVSLSIIRSHHERIPGDGYPLALRGSELQVPVLAVAIADVYDAMTSDRIYHQGIGTDLALRMMYEQAAQTFGQELMEAFIRCVGIYPVGSLVELGNQALGLVIDAGEDTRLLPRVLLVRNADGRMRPEPTMLDLAELSQGGRLRDWTIRRVVSTAEAGFDPRRIMLEQAGLRLPGFDFGQPS
ncbi:MAG: HD-GYP domain-containing protein [Ectothiorhodospiraceae bacterium]|nr:HD-GYP domain-containing protein [Ectothiorhodospiraceae bacterium]